VIGLDVALRADRRPIHTDPLSDQLQMRAGVATYPEPHAGQQRIQHPGHRRLAVRARNVQHRITPLRRTEQIYQRRDPNQRWFDPAFRPTTVQVSLNLPESGQRSIPGMYRLWSHCQITRHEASPT
jgi:hypothetical protein